jgi:hypothetical protein
VVNTNGYDSWGKLVNSSVSNASTTLTTTIVYNKLSSGGYTTTTTNNLNLSVVEYDVLGREVRKSTKGLPLDP